MTVITSVKGRGHPELIIQLEFNILKLSCCWAHSFQPPFHFFSLSLCSASVQCYYFFQLLSDFHPSYYKCLWSFFPFFSSCLKGPWVVKQAYVFLIFFFPSFFLFFFLPALHRFIWGEEGWLNSLLKSGNHWKDHGLQWLQWHVSPCSRDEVVYLISYFSSGAGDDNHLSWGNPTPQDCPSAF